MSHAPYIDPAPFLEIIKKLKSARYIADATMTNELHKVADRHLARCKKNTPKSRNPDGPTLQTRWDRSGVHGMSDGLYAEVLNTAEHAAYVEFGHRQKPGRVIFIELSPGEAIYGRPAVPVKKGKHEGQWGVYLRLKKPYVKGRFMMTDSEQKAQRELDAAAKHLEQIIREELG